MGYCVGYWVSNFDLSPQLIGLSLQHLLPLLHNFIIKPYFKSYLIKIMIDWELSHQYHKKHQV